MDSPYSCHMRNTILTIISSLVVFACAVESATERNDPDSVSTESAMTEPAQVQIPSELRVDHLPQASCGVSNGATFNDGTCFVSIICHDARFSCFPTLCTNGLCNGRAPTIASQLCSQACSSNTNCGAGNFFQACP